MIPLPFAPAGPRVDGDLSDWPQRFPEFHLPSPEPADSSAVGRLLFTPDTIYVAARVRDDDGPHNPYPPLHMWNGDAIGVYLGLCGPTRRTVINKNFEYQLGLAPTTEPGDPAAFHFHADVPLRTARVQVVRENGGYIVEASIPLWELNSLIPALEEGSAVGVDLTLEDLDPDDWVPAGNSRTRSLIWNGTPMNWIDPSGWGMGILCRPDAY